MFSWSVMWLVARWPFSRPPRAGIRPRYLHHSMGHDLRPKVGSRSTDAACTSGRIRRMECLAGISSSGSITPSMVTRHELVPRLQGSPAMTPPRDFPQPTYLTIRRTSKQNSTSCELMLLAHMPSSRRAIMSASPQTASSPARSARSPTSAVDCDHTSWRPEGPPRRGGLEAPVRDGSSYRRQGSYEAALTVAFKAAAYRSRVRRGPLVVATRRPCASVIREDRRRPVSHRSWPLPLE